MQAGKNLVKRRGVQAFFIFEVVIEQRFIDAGAAGNLICARSGYAFMGELFQSGFEDSGTGFLRLAAGAGLAGFDGRYH